VYYLDGINTILITLALKEVLAASWLLNVSFIEDVSLSASALEQNMTIHFLITAIQATNRKLKFNNNFKLVRQKRHLLQKDLCLKNGKRKNNTSYISVRRSYLQFFCLKP
jgi:hypothetical protein